MATHEQFLGPPQKPNPITLRAQRHHYRWPAAALPTPNIAEVDAVRAMLQEQDGAVKRPPWKRAATLAMLVRLYEDNLELPPANAIAKVVSRVVPDHTCSKFTVDQALAAVEQQGHIRIVRDQIDGFVRSRVQPITLRFAVPSRRLMETVRKARRA